LCVIMSSSATLNVQDSRTPVLAADPAVAGGNSTSQTTVIETGEHTDDFRSSTVINAGQELRGASFAGASFNFVKGMLGAGILSLPRAVQHCGLWVALIAGVFLLIVCYMSMFYINKAKRLANERVTGDPYVGPYVSYKDVAFASFGKKGQIAIICGILGHQMCIASGWVIVILNTTQSLIDFIDFPRFVLVLWFFPVFFMLSLIKYVKHLAPFSFFGCMVYAIGIVGISYIHAFQNADFDDWAKATKLWDFSKAPLFMSTYTYAIEGIIGVLPNESSLKKPQQSNAFIAFSLFFYGINALIFALITYLAGFGKFDTVIFAYDRYSPVTDVVKVCLVFALVMTHPLGINYAAEPIEQILFSQSTNEGNTPNTEITPLVQTSINTEGDQTPIKSAQRSDSLPDISDATRTTVTKAAVSTPNKPPSFFVKHGRLIIRTTFIVISCFVGWLVPNFSNFSNFVGSFFLSFIGFIAPPAMYIKLSKHRRWYNVLPAAALIVYGFAFLVIGTFSATYNVLNK